MPKDQSSVCLQRPVRKTTFNLAINFFLTFEHHKQKMIHKIISNFQNKIEDLFQTYKTTCSIFQLLVEIKSFRSLMNSDLSETLRSLPASNQLIKPEPYGGQ